MFSLVRTFHTPFIANMVDFTSIDVFAQNTRLYGVQHCALIFLAKTLKFVVQSSSRYDGV